MYVCVTNTHAGVLTYTYAHTHHHTHAGTHTHTPPFEAGTAVPFPSLFLSYFRFRGQKYTNLVNNSDKTIKMKFIIVFKPIKN